MNEVAKEWVDKAESDFDAADLTLHGKETPIVMRFAFTLNNVQRSISRHSCRSIAFDLKGGMSLIPLLELCSSLDDEFEVLREPLHSLERYAVLIRYPGLTIPAEMAEKAFRSTTLVRDFMRRKLEE